MDISPAALRSFLVLASELHFGRAAEILHISTPSLSVQIGRLEQSLDQKLFSRTSRQARLTTEGESFLPIAREAVAAHDEVEAWARQGSKFQNGHLRVGLGGGGLGPFNSPILSEAIARIPGLRLEIKGVDLVHVSAGLRDRSLDVLMGPALAGTDEPGDIQVTHSVDDHRVLVVGADHPLADRESVALAETSAETYIRIGEDVGVSHLQSWMMDPRPDGTRLRWGPQAHDFEGVLELCAAGLGVNIAAGTASHRYRWPGIVFIPIHDAPPVQLTVAVLRGTRSPIVAEFLSVIDHVLTTPKGRPLSLG